MYEKLSGEMIYYRSETNKQRLFRD